jgi:hypothetical protein
MGAPVLQLSLRDVHGEPIKESALVRLRNLSSSAVKQVQGNPGRTLSIRGLKGRPKGLYVVEVDPPGYLSSSKFIEVQASGITQAEMVFAVDASRVRDVSLPAYADLPAEARAMLENSTRVRGFEGLSGQTLYEAFDDIRCAGLLNVIAKTRVTASTPGQSVLSQLAELLDLRGDRCFCVVPQSLRDDTKNAALAGLFKAVDGGLHHFDDGFSEAGSFKTPDSYGNLQLTFFASADRWVADIDIDDAGGIGHLFQVIRNEVKNRTTHPYDIQQILLRHQSLDPMYRLLV